MKDTNICYPLQKLGYKGDIVITDQGLIIDRANQSLLQPNKRGLYKRLPIVGKQFTEPSNRSTDKPLGESMRLILQRTQRANYGSPSTAGASIT